MGWNEPDDWDAYYTTCPQCGAHCHMSGSDACNCEPCELCGELVPPRIAEENRIDDVVLCDKCADAHQCLWCGRLAFKGLLVDKEGDKYCPGECWEKGADR